MLAFSNNTFAIKEIWINTGFDNLRRLRADIDYDKEKVEVFYIDLEKFSRENRTFFKVIIKDFEAKIGIRRFLS
uniref:Transcriptional regulator n=1 Tax=Angiostrongylus cantonensis TaxID=6313 RepID=A0A0K0CWX7_ANGCA